MYLHVKQGGEFQETLMVGFQGDGFMKTFGGWGKKTEKISFKCKTELRSFKLQMSSGPPAGKKEMCDVCRGSVVCLNDGHEGI